MAPWIVCRVAAIVADISELIISGKIKGRIDWKHKVRHPPGAQAIASSCMEFDSLCVLSGTCVL